MSRPLKSVEWKTFLYRGGSAKRSPGSRWKQGLEAVLEFDPGQRRIITQALLDRRLSLGVAGERAGWIEPLSRMVLIALLVVWTVASCPALSSRMVVETTTTGTA